MTPITVWVGQTNLGQGTHTGIPMIIADELDADWKKIQVKMALAAEPFKSPVWHTQATGGSSSIRHRWDLFRKVGAPRPGMDAGGSGSVEQWKIPKGKMCRQRRQGHASGRKQPDLWAAGGSRRKTSGSRKPGALKESKGLSHYRHPEAAAGYPRQSDGENRFRYSISPLPGMCIAVVARPPRYGAKLQSYDAEKALAVKGVIKAVPLEDRVAVCADTTYAAMKGRDALDIKWSEADPGRT